MSSINVDDSEDALQHCNKMMWRDYELIRREGDVFLLCFSSFSLDLMLKQISGVELQTLSPESLKQKLMKHLSKFQQMIFVEIIDHHN